MARLAAATFLLLAACTQFDPKDYPQLKIRDVRVGKGEPVGGRDTIYANYVGRFPSGKVFDRNDPAKPRRYSMASRSLIKGWRIGILGMKPGGKRELTIPPDLAFGKKGKYGSIPPNATLIFEIELVRIH